MHLSSIPTYGLQIRFDLTIDHVFTELDYVIIQLRARFLVLNLFIDIFAALIKIVNLSYSAYCFENAVN